MGELDRRKRFNSAEEVKCCTYRFLCFRTFSQLIAAHWRGLSVRRVLLATWLGCWEKTMKIDIYTKFVLTLIAGALVWNVAKDFPKDAQALQATPNLAHFENQYSLARSRPKCPFPCGSRAFRRAVEGIVENCSVDGGTISC